MAKNGIRIQDLQYDKSEEEEHSSKRKTAYWSETDQSLHDQVWEL